MTLDPSILAKKSLRYLKLVAKKSVALHQSSSNQFVVLEVEGERSIRCERRIIEKWVSSGLVQISKKQAGGTNITATHNATQILRRLEATDYADQHRQMDKLLITDAGSSSLVAVNIKESPLASLYLIKRQGKAWLQEAEFQAGERLRSDFEFSQLGPRITASWDPTATLSSKGGRRPTENLNERAMGARQRLNRAIDAVGPELSGVLLDVCCFLKGIEQVERERQWPRRSAKLLLKAALSALSRHYNPEVIDTKRKQLRHWGVGDFRPEM